MEAGLEHYHHHFADRKSSLSTGALSAGSAFRSRQHQNNEQQIARPRN